MLDSVLTEIRDQVAIISLIRPEALNAWNGPLCQALDDALKRASSNDKVGAIVITGVSSPTTFMNGSGSGDYVAVRLGRLTTMNTGFVGHRLSPEQ